MSKNDVNEREGRAALESISANTERVITLRKASQTEAAASLAAETEELIVSLSGKGSVSLKQESRDALREALATAEPISGVVVETGADDPLTTAGVPELIAEGAKRARSGIELGTKMGDVGRELAAVMLDIRMKFNRKGLPDLEARDGRTKKAVRFVYDTAMEGVAKDDVTKSDARKTLELAVRRRTQDAVVDFLRSLNDLPRAEVLAYFPQVSATAFEAAGSHTEAVYATYSEAGMELPRKGYTERQRELMAARTTPNEIEAGEDEDADIMTRSGDKLGKAKNLLSQTVKLAGRLDNDDRAKLKAELSSLIMELSAEANKL
jgi:hypothetical protein